jgi:hypothetical protein
MHLPRLLTLAAATALPLTAQNLLEHIAGTGFTSRGSNSTAAKVLLQCMPMDQARGRTNLADLVMAIQDQEASTPESFTIEIRTDNPLAPGTPDMTPAGVLGSVGPITFQFPGTGPSAVFFTVPLGIATPPFVGGVPAGDLYAAIVFPPAPAWPLDGISLQCDLNEPMSALAIGYTGVAGVAGLAWESLIGGPPSLAGNNRAWAMGMRFVDDTLQPFAVLPTSPFASPNFGYVGLFPDLVRGDQIGWHALATASTGDLAALLIGTPLSVPAPAPLPVNSGLLCLNTAQPLLNVGLAFYGPASGQPATTVEAIWGPYHVSPVFAGTPLFAQALSFKGGSQLVLTTSCRTQL